MWPFHSAKKVGVRPATPEKVDVGRIKFTVVYLDEKDEKVTKHLMIDGHQRYDRFFDEWEVFTSDFKNYLDAYPGFISVVDKLIPLTRVVYVSKPTLVELLQDKKTEEPEEDNK